MLTGIGNFLLETGAAIWMVLLELSPSLLLGLLIAGVLHVFLPKGIIERRLSRSNLRSVIEAVAIGVPMPLCSCGVVPTAVGLQRDGASKGAATGFLISTPQTGVDSVAVSAAFLGWPFAIFKVVAAFVTGVIGGVIVNATEPSAKTAKVEVGPVIDRCEQPEQEGLIARLRGVVRFALFDLLAMIDTWLVVGIVASALITTLVPPGFFENFELTQGLTGMLLMLAFALPLYVCTTSSVPIAASLIAAGLPLGSALVFLMAGPATNVATLGAVHRALGGRVMLIYLAVVAVFSVAFGMFFEAVLTPATSPDLVHTGHDHGILAVASAVVVVALLAVLLARRVASRLGRGQFQAPVQGGDEMDMVITVKGMTCGHCVANVKKALEALPGVERAEPDLRSGRVIIDGEPPAREEIERVIREAGYDVV